MIKKVLTLLVTSTLISAGLLFMGFTMMQKFSPAMAAPLEALVLGPKAQVSTTADFSADEAQQAEDLSSDDKLSESASLPESTSDRSDDSSRSLTSSDDAVKSEITGLQVMISDVLANPEQYRGQVLVISGIATSLSSEKIMLNDGTGNILVDFDEEWFDVAKIDGMTVTVVAKIDDSSSAYEFELEACSLEDTNGVTLFDDDCGNGSTSTGDDDSNDDSDDTYDDDSNDDSDNDMDGDNS